MRTEDIAAGRDDIRVELGADHVAIVELARGPHNYFDVAMLTALADRLEELAQGPCRAVVLCSEGRNFCAGAQLGGVSPGPTTGPHLYDVALRIFEQPLPIVAAVQGAAIGGGLGLALAADFRVATPQAWFTANFARLGFHHGFALTVTLPRVIGQTAAADLLYTGRRVDASEAVQIGLCDVLVAESELRAAALSQARQIAAAAPLAVRSIRETMRMSLLENVRAAFARERTEQDRLMLTRDFAEGVAAVADRRDPSFNGS